FFLALGALILGIGAFKPNISSQVGALYPPGDPRRDRAYSIFYIGINLGAFLAPLVCGTLGTVFGWHYGFAAAGVGMLISLAIYLSRAKWLPAEGSGPVRSARRHPEVRAERASKGDSGLGDPNDALHLGGRRPSRLATRAPQGDGEGSALAAPDAGSL